MARWPMIETSSRRLALAAWLCRPCPMFVSNRLRMLLYPRSRARRERVEFTRRSSLGRARMRFHAGDDIAWCYALTGCFNWRNVTIARAVCGPGDTILELGANIGSETLLYARIVGAAGHVFAFEPVPRLAAALRQSVELSELKQITMAENAVGAEPGRVTFQLADDPNNAGTGHVLSRPAARSGATIDVEVTTLDRFCDAAAAGGIRPRFVVMDIEGAELDALRGGQALIANVRPVVVLEINAPRLRERGLAPDAIEQFLAARDYECRAIGRYGLLPVGQTSSQAVDWIAVPRTPDGAHARLLAKIHRRLFWAAVLPLYRGVNPAVVG